MNKKIIFSAGGTGGHIFPAINLMMHLSEKGYEVILVTDKRGNSFLEDNSEDFNPYEHDKKTLARSWAIPGTKGLEHRIGGLEKENISGNVSYDPDNHHYMTLQRQKKVDIISNFIPPSIFAPLLKLSIV